MPKPGRPDVEAEQQELFQAESRIDPRKIDQRAQVEPRARQQQKGDPDLQGEKDPPRAQSGRAERAAALQPVHGIDPADPAKRAGFQDARAVPSATTRAKPKTVASSEKS